ncbi:MAG: hypothetical protein AB1782_16840 [Cyanobacteriota bacterium]
MRIRARVVVGLLLMALLIPGTVFAKKNFKIKSFDIPPNFSAAVPKNTSIGAARPGNFLTPYASVVYDTHPTFEWLQPACSEEEKCRVAIKQLGEGEKKIYEAWDVSANKFTFQPAEKGLLKEGSIYTFEVNRPKYENEIMGEETLPVYFYILSKQDKTGIIKELNTIKTKDEDEKAIAEMNVFVDNAVWHDAVNRLNKVLSKYPDDQELIDFKEKLYDAASKSKYEPESASE